MASLTQMFEYLDELRESGVTNMFGAGPYVERRFDLPASEANDVLVRWMDTFSEEPAADRAAKAEES